jgi:hypothetical protein
MTEVNSWRESQALERGLELLAPTQGEQPSARNGRIPGLFRADRRAERMSLSRVLAEGEELWSNPLHRVFNDLRTTQNLAYVDWRILGVLRRSAGTAVAEARGERSCGLVHQRVAFVTDLHHQHLHWLDGIRVLGLHRLAAHEELPLHIAVSARL